MNLVDIEKRKALRYALLLQLYDDFFCYGYEVCIKIDYIVPDYCRIEIIAALYFLFYLRWIFFNIEKDNTVSAYILGRGIEEVEDNVIEVDKFLLSNVYGNLLIPVKKESETNESTKEDYKSEE